MKRILIVGLGNPGREYEKTRHNVGFIVMNTFLNKKQLGLTEKYKGYYAKYKEGNNEIFVLLPQTYMNNSGESVAELAHFFKIEPQNIVVIHDDLDLKMGEVKYKTKGSSGGHNGLKSIIKCLGSENFKRIKVGISKPQEAVVIDYVLGKFSKSDRLIIDEEAIDICNFLEQYTKCEQDNAFDYVLSKLANERNKKI